MKTDVHFVSLRIIFIFSLLTLRAKPLSTLPAGCNFKKSSFPQQTKFRFKFAFFLTSLNYSFHYFLSFPLNHCFFLFACLCNLHFLSCNLNCKYILLKFIFYSSHMFLHMAPFAKLTVHWVSQKSLFRSFYGVLSQPKELGLRRRRTIIPGRSIVRLLRRLKELQGDCIALGNHKTVKQAPLKTKPHREQGWINENATSRNIHSNDR